MPLTLSFLWPHHLWLLPALLVLPAAYVWLLLACPGIDTLEAAKMAADRGVRIYVVGLGTVDGTASRPRWANTRRSTCSWTRIAAATLSLLWFRRLA